MVAAQQAQKNGLQHVLGIRGISGNPVRRTEHQAMMGLKYILEPGIAMWINLAGHGGDVFLFQRELQIAPPILSDPTFTDRHT